MSESVKYNIVGVMSGTSLDGLDLALCEFSITDGVFDFKILDALTVKYDKKQKTKLQSAPYLNVENYFSLHHQFGRFIAKEVNLFTANHSLVIKGIASHGHTIFHQPKKGFSTQLGCGATITANTGLITICDFRSLDVALKGQGAPLVPIGDKLLFGNHQSCLNIGGIANISFDNLNGQRTAFDICVANLGLNFYSEKVGKDYDHNGEMAAEGKLCTELFNDLNNLPFFKATGAKSLGREWFENDFLRVIENYQLTVNDILCTLTHHCAYQISQTLNNNKLNNVFITGGGAFNNYLINTLKHYFNGTVTIPDEQVVNFKESLIFAFLGYLRLTEQTNTLCTVTGAVKDSIGGAVYFSNNKI